ncbi:MAG: FAD-dependent oxidoreductase, partial [Calditrichaceae bacterium]
MSRKIVVIGGVAAGMSAASRARRNDPDASIIVFQKENAVSYGSCGLPYFISNDIKEAETLIAITADEFRQKRNIDVRLNQEGLSFNPREKTVEIRELKTGMITDYPYDKLIIATGARATVPPIPGKDLKNVFVVRNLTDGQNIKSYIGNEHPANAVIVGGGYIGLEMAEALSRQGLRVTVVEAQDRVMLNMDPELSDKIKTELEEKGCKVYTSNGVHAILGSDRVN